MEVSRRTFTLAGLLFSITAFLSKKNEKALLTLKFLLLYSLRVVCKMAVTCVLSFGRQESLVVTLRASPCLRQQPGSPGLVMGLCRIGYFGVTLQ